MDKIKNDCRRGALRWTKSKMIAGEVLADGLKREKVAGEVLADGQTQEKAAGEVLSDGLNRKRLPARCSPMD